MNPLSLVLAAAAMALCACGPRECEGVRSQHFPVQFATYVPVGSPACGDAQPCPHTVSVDRTAGVVIQKIVRDGRAYEVRYRITGSKTIDRY